MGEKRRVAQNVDIGHERDGRYLGRDRGNRVREEIESKALGILTLLDRPDR
jgi:hypothetical protein